MICPIPQILKSHKLIQENVFYAYLACLKGWKLLKCFLFFFDKIYPFEPPWCSEKKKSLLEFLYASKPYYTYFHITFILVFFFMIINHKKCHQNNVRYPFFSNLYSSNQQSIKIVIYSFWFTRYYLIMSNSCSNKLWMQTLWVLFRSN